VSLQVNKLTVARGQRTVRCSFYLQVYFVIYTMNFIDIVLVVVILYFAYKGFKNGLIIEVFTLLALILGIYAGIHFSDGTANLMHEHWGFDSEYLPIIAFTFTMLGVGAMIYFGGKFLEKVVDISGLSIANKLGGLGFAVLKALYILSVLIVMIESYDEKGKFMSEASKNESLLFLPVKNISISTIPYLKESGLFVKDSLMNAANRAGLTIEQLIEAKRMADSLGIDAEDAMELKHLHDSLNLN